MNMFKKNGGFTLVELIVVIAILAILAGVAVPAYTGYLDRAHKAADDTAIATMNTAIAAAAAANGGAASECTATLTGSKTAELAVTALSLGDTSILADFNTFYAGNTSAPLAYYTGVSFTAGEIVGTEPTN